MIQFAKEMYTSYTASTDEDVTSAEDIIQIIINSIRVDRKWSNKNEYKVTKASKF